MPEVQGAATAQSSASAPPPPPPMAPPQPAADIQFDCPSCSQRLSVPAQTAGQVTQCPCGTQLRIPQAPAPAADPFALPNELAPASQPLDQLEEIGLEPINDPYSPMPGPPPLQDPFAPAPGATAGNPYGATSTPAYLQSGTATNGGKRKVKRKVRERESEPSSGFSIGGQVLGGLGMMALAVIWFVGGLMGGIIFFYPPILFILGLIAMVRGFFDPD